MATETTDEYELSALWFHILPLANHDYVRECRSCGEEEELVPPEHLYFLCRHCHPSSFTDHL